LACATISNAMPGKRGADGPLIALDVSRLVSRAGRPVPTGIDRVELAYAEHLITGGRPRLYAAMARWGGFGLLPQRQAEAYVAAIASAWRGEGEVRRHERRSRRLKWRFAASPLWGGEQALHRRLAEAASAYVLVSHHHLDKRGSIERLKQRSKARFVCLIHDLIPIEFPEYALPGQNWKHRRRIRTAAALADAVIVNSAVTRDAFQPHLDRLGRAPPVMVAPFGVDLPPPAPDGPALLARPYFVCVSTIEARKNHLLLLNLWRSLAERSGAAAPLLVLIGQRGWETENAVDMLERCPGLRGLVIEHNNLPDAEMAKLLRGARALLLPSFAEGFGFPLIEALAQGVPALVSAIPALRESGGAVPEYFDPIDGAGWRQAVIDYAAADSPRRAAQLRRLARWRPPSWQDHFAAVDALIAETAARPPVPLATPDAAADTLTRLAARGTLSLDAGEGGPSPPPPFPPPLAGEG
jgi:glycosyltransferase involved in cell wall biosynthesis